MAVELRHLRYLVAIAESGTFTLAAERLHMAQPPLSQQVQRLEEDLGVRLFERSRRGVTLTEAGQQLLDRARTILALSEEFRSFARGLAEGHEGSLRIGMAGGVTLHPLIPAAIQGFRQARKGVEVTLEESNTPALCAALRNGQVDVAIIRPPVFDPQIVVHPLMDEPTMIVLPSSHARHKARKLSLHDIAGDPLILFERHLGPGFYDTIIAAFLQTGVSPQLGQHAPQVAAIIPMVAAGMGVAIVPSYLSQIHARGVSFHPISGPMPRATIAMALARATPNRAVTAFEAILRTLCTQGQGALGPAGVQG
ncbi:LysR family transcriptional regulator [Asaia krungthepensis]|uniref:LysR family transcriptional regulator n=1 Tax=Asaia krungthepensis NRIC 0535 TaxID=1307925 RepID=A0ABQ0PYR2_9PROT|nr:LysR family transcriptional regulator [Asaia krungthepensis]GBQ84938.1 LysR family transcriptional regulator [Asaia krungthepensis NRIC 0535]